MARRRRSAARTSGLKPAQIILIGFLAAISVGTLLLMLPVSSAAGTWTSLADALFTATSATCVTGLVVQNTATYWSTFGQVVILCLIQIGGMGVITFLVAFSMLVGQRVSLRRRWIMQESISAPHVGGILGQTRFIITTSAAIELVGAALLAVRFVPEFGVGRGLWYALFHSVSAFCNAGFDLLGYDVEYASLTAYGSDPYVLVVVATLVVVGGIGFLTWGDIREHGTHFRRYSLQTKLVLVTTAALLAFGFCFFMYEFSLPQWSDLTLGERVLSAVFQTVTPRTAGFNAVDLTNLSEAGQLVTIVLMLIGCSPGSTAGGFKVTTLAVLVMSTFATFRGKRHVETRHRRIATRVQRNATAVFMLYLTLFMGAGLVICCVDGVSLMEALFEAASAVATVGLSLGITPGLSLVSRTVLVCLMYLGRAGGLTMMYALVERDEGYKSKYPQEPVAVG